MARTKAANVIPFAPRAASIKEKRKSEALAQRKKELRFKSRVTKPREHPLAHLTVDELVDEIGSSQNLADAWRRAAKIWRKLYNTSRRELGVLTRKNACLEKQLADHGRVKRKR